MVELQKSFNPRSPWCSVPIDTFPRGNKRLVPRYETEPSLSTEHQMENQLVDKSVHTNQNGSTLAERTESHKLPATAAENSISSNLSRLVMPPLVQIPFDQSTNSRERGTSIRDRDKSNSYNKNYCFAASTEFSDLSQFSNAQSQFPTRHSLQAAAPRNSLALLNERKPVQALHTPASARIISQIQNDDIARSNGTSDAPTAPASMRRQQARAQTQTSESNSNSNHSFSDSRAKQAIDQGHAPITRTPCWADVLRSGNTSNNSSSNKFRIDVSRCESIVSESMVSVQSDSLGNETLPTSLTSCEHIHEPPHSPVFNSPSKLSFVEQLNSYRPESYASTRALISIVPRGLLNTGNTCFMNVILQVMIYCRPMQNFVSFVRKNAPMAVLCSSPLTEALLLFFDEFESSAIKIPDGQLNQINPAASSNSQLSRQQLVDLELTGQPFIPEQFYSAVHSNARFRSLERGHQQDAEEFLGILLDGLHEELVQAIDTKSRRNASVDTHTSKLVYSQLRTERNKANADGWTNVARKQKGHSALTRVAQLENTPITQIFSGRLRSTICRPGQKDSVILEPFHTLQLDIQSDDVQSIDDALRAITEPEYLRESSSTYNGASGATKQMHIEELPQVLVLHLKRFLFDGSDVHKLYKTVSFPHELKVPNECMASDQQQLSNGGSANSRKFRLFAVVYHHGASAAGGHYTVETLNGRNWLLFDDTHVVKYIASEAQAIGRAEHPSQTLNLDRTAYLLFYERL